MLVRLKILVLSLLLLHLGTLQAEQKYSTKPFLIGFAQDTLANDWRLAQANELKKTLGKFPNIKLIITDANGHTAKQISDIEDLVSRKVDLLITSPKDALALTPVISSVYKKGIPVILLDRGITTSDYTTLIGADNRLIAQHAAEYLVKSHPKGGRILMLKGVPNATPTIHRTDKFVNVINKRKKFKIVAQKTANYLRGDAIKAVEEVIDSKINFDIVYAQSDSMATGARMALALAGKDLNKISIVGIDYIKEAQTAIRAGQQLASFTYPTGGKEGGELAVKILHGEKVKKRIIIKSQIITKNNVDSIKPIF